MGDNDLHLIAHLMRRAGFGARRDELEAYAAKGYDAVVDDLLNTQSRDDVDQDILDRYYASSTEGGDEAISQGHWVYRMVNGDGPLLEKMALFWHHVFATGSEKVGHPPASKRHLQMFRRVGLTDLRNILIELSKDPAMIMWLDNNQNFGDAPNENFGRELLELFSMGVGNYTEEDVKAAAQAFTGWTFTWSLRQSGARDAFPTYFDFVGPDHDRATKTFLGETGPFNGEDVIDVIVRQPATARFISRHLYTFFVADEPPVASWNETLPQDQEAIDILVKAYLESHADVRHVLGALFRSDFFKQAMFKRVKSPVELVTGMAKLIGPEPLPDFDSSPHANAAGEMGQSLGNPLTVEGWHTGREWIDGGTLSTRVEYATEQVADVTKPGIRAIVDRLAANDVVSPTDFVDRCVELVGPVPVGADTRQGLLTYAESEGDLSFGSDADRERNEARVVRMLQLIVSAREFQFN